MPIRDSNPNSKATIHFGSYKNKIITDYNYKFISLSLLQTTEKANKFLN